MLDLRDLTRHPSRSPQRASWLLTVLSCVLFLAPALGADTLVVANKAEATVSLVDLPSGEVRATLPTGEGPHEVAVSPDGRRALITNYGHREAPGSSLTLLDVPKAEVLATLKLGEHRRPHGVLWLADGRRAVVTAEGSRSLLVVDVEGGEVLRAIDTNQEVSHMVALAPDGSRAFVANIGSGSMTVIDLESGERVANVPTGEGAEGIAVAAGGTQVWVTNRAADTVSVFDARSLEPIAELASASFPIRAVATPDGRRVLVTNARSDELAIFDVEKRAEVRRLKTGLEAADTEGRLFGDRFGGSSVPIGVLVSPDGERAYVAHANADVISEIDLESGERLRLLRAGKEPDGMAYSSRDVEKDEG